jgi:hypothetical protein
MRISRTQSAQAYTTTNNGPAVCSDGDETRLAWPRPSIWLYSPPGGDSTSRLPLLDIADTTPAASICSTNLAARL